MPTFTTEALSPADRALLRDLAASGRNLQRALWAVALLLGVGGGALAVHSMKLPPIEIWAARTVAALALLGSLALLWAVRRQRRRTTTPARAALARGQKSITVGQLQGIVPAGRLLRYMLDGEAIELQALLAADGRGEFDAGRPVRSIEHLAPAPVALHWVEAAGQRWLLQAHPLALPAAQHAHRPASHADRRRASGRALKLLGFVAVIYLVCYAVLVVVTGFDRDAIHIGAVTGAATWALIAVIAALPTLLRAQRQSHVHVLRAPVTEVLRARVPSGKSTVEAHWYRAGGVAHCALGFDDSLRPGDMVHMEWLTRARAEAGEGLLMRVDRIAADR